MILRIKRIKSELSNSNFLTNHFILYNLSKGLGLTLGNSLRRLLLSNLKGTAIIAIKIPGIFSEFSSIYGLREDVLELILNLKEVILQSNSNELHYGKIMVNGPGVITAKCLIFTTFVNIINPNIYLATIYNKQTINFEIIATNNKGYTFNKNIKLLYPTYLNIDAIFMPVLRVNYRIKTQNNIMNKFTESLLLEITTNGSFSPNKALLDSAKFIKTIFKKIKNYGRNKYLHKY